MVMVMCGGEEVKLFKCVGSYLILCDLIEEVGCDVICWFLIVCKFDL